MTAGAWLRCQREALGLPLRTAATLLGTTVYQLQKIEMQDHPVPSDLRHRMALIIAETVIALDLLTQDPTAPIEVYRSNQALWANYPQWRNTMPVQWFRVVAARAAAITGQTITYWTP